MTNNILYEVKEILFLLIHTQLAGKTAFLFIIYLRKIYKPNIIKA